MSVRLFPLLNLRAEYLAVIHFPVAQLCRRSRELINTFSSTIKFLNRLMHRIAYSFFAHLFSCVDYKNMGNRKRVCQINQLEQY